MFEIGPILSQFTYLDGIAFGWFLLCNVGYSIISARLSISIANALHFQRKLWMQNMMEREVRLIDVMVVQGFMHTNGFFATTSVFALGGLIAIIGTGETALNVINNIPFAMNATLLAFQLKVSLLVALFIVAFFKFVWAYRLATYTTIAIGACPIASSDNEELRQIQAELAARLSQLAARHSYTGIRSYYFAIAALGWFFHPIVLIITTTWVILVLYRREYLSRSVQAIHAAVQKEIACTNKDQVQK